MHSPEDRTAKARIRDAAIELFGGAGGNRVSLKHVADAAGVSAPLVIKHYGSRDGLETAADDHALGVVEELLRQATAPPTPDSAQSLAQILGRSHVGRYVARVLTGEGGRSRRAFARLLAFAENRVARLVDEGRVRRGTDPAHVAAVLLAHDLSVLLLRARLADATGVDPLSPEGADQWLATTSDLYAGRIIVSG